MTAHNLDNEQLFTILSDAQTIAVVGASSRPEKPSHSIMKVLQEHGYHVIPVNPNEESVLGEKAWPSLQSVPASVDIVNVFRRSEATPPIADDAVKIGAKALWLQKGISNEEAAQTAEEGGLEVIMDNCIAVTLKTLRVPEK